MRNGISRHSKGLKNLDDPTAEQAATLEGQVVRIADRIAYINHDIDDAIRAEILKADQLPIKEMALLGSSHSERITTMVTDIVEFSSGKPIVGMSHTISRATDSLKDFLFERVYWNVARGNQDLRKAQHIIVALFRLYMEQPEQMQLSDQLKSLDKKQSAQRICDYIAGMTDRYAISCFEQMFVPKAVRSGI